MSNCQSLRPGLGWSVFYLSAVPNKADPATISLCQLHRTFLVARHAPTHIIDMSKSWQMCSDDFVFKFINKLLILWCSEPSPIMDRKEKRLAWITFLNLFQNMVIHKRLDFDMARPFKTVSSGRGHQIPLVWLGREKEKWEASGCLSAWPLSDTSEMCF